MCLPQLACVILTSTLPTPIHLEHDPCVNNVNICDQSNYKSNTLADLSSVLNENVVKNNIDPFKIWLLHPLLVWDFYLAPLLLVFSFPLYLFAYLFLTWLFWKIQLWSWLAGRCKQNLISKVDLTMENLFSIVDLIYAISTSK